MSYFFAGLVLHVPKTDPASVDELHGHPEVAAQDPRVPQSVLETAQGEREPRISNRHLQAGSHQARGKN